MDPKISKLLEKMNSLEDELQEALHAQEVRLFYQLKGKGIEFETHVRNAHRQLKIGIWKWLLINRPQNLITAPLIYSLIVPLIMLDLSVSLYQAICFPIYRIAKVRRKNYLRFDHRHLEYINIIERFHCSYCSYANGILAYTLEIAGRTEQYFCPIKHAHKILGRQRRYRQFLEYGDADGYHKKLEEFRNSLEKENEL